MLGSVVIWMSVMVVRIKLFSRTSEHYPRVDEVEVG